MSKSDIDEFAVPVDSGLRAVDRKTQSDYELAARLKELDEARKRGLGLIG